MVGLGSTRTGPTNSVEIIDLSSPEFGCSNFPAYPLALERGAKGVSGFEEIPLICGGKSTSECKTYVNGSWRTLKSMATSRWDFAMTRSSFCNITELFLAGGYNGERLRTAEFWRHDSFDNAPQQLPVGIDGHCIAVLNQTSLIIIGGEEDKNGISAKTNILNTNNLQWSDGPKLSAPRYLSSCARIAKNSHRTEFSIIVAGGFKTYDIPSVEIMDEGTNIWRKGPELPFGICCSAMVEHPDGGVVLIGGRRDGSTYLDTIFHLPHAGDDAKWEKLPQKLKVGRGHHTAFLVPDVVADSC